MNLAEGQVFEVSMKKPGNHGGLRPATEADLPGITHVRTSVRENHLSVEQLAERGITQETVAARMRSGDLGNWVVAVNDEVVAFAMADKTTGNLFALFILPDHEGQGYGSTLLSTCETWLQSHGVHEAILDTDRKGKAVTFYTKRGWVEYGGDEEEVLMRKGLVG